MGKDRIIKKLICFIFGHKYWVIREYSPTVRKVGCKRCFGEWGMNDSVKAFVPWDSELEELYPGRLEGGQP